MLPGEAELVRIFTDIPDERHLAKESVWALYTRLLLIWTSVLRVWYGGAPRLDTVVEGFTSPGLAVGCSLDGDKARLIIQAWAEISAIEAAFNKHTCSFEAASKVAGRELVFRLVSFPSVLHVR
jgi:hypothetical protein